MKIKTVVDKPTGNIILNDEKLQVFPLRSGIRPECLLPSFLVNNLLAVLASATRQEKEMTGIQIRMEEVK